MTDLSPATQAVLDAFNEVYESDRHAVAAALRAAADQVDQKLRGFSREACQEILSIAAELEAQ